VNYRTRRAWRAGGSAVIVLVATLAYLFFNQVHLGDRADRNEQTASDAVSGLTTANKQIDGLKKSVDEANRRLFAAGKPTVPVPSVSPVSPPQLPDGLTSSQTAEVRSIVVTELAQQKVTLSPAEVTQIARAAAALVPKPKDGVTPTAAELQAIAAAAVDVYCADGRCVGKQGDPGATVTGAPGKDAPPVTDEQLAARVAAYCASDSQPCKGDTGSPGAAGTPGADGRGISAGPTCLGEGDDSYWLTRYTDGTEQRQDGPCRLQSLLPTTPPSN
jgi:hypothetical protein